MENLISDGRIQPARIEEVVEKARAEVEKTIKQKGEMAAYEAGIIDLDPRLLTVLGGYILEPVMARMFYNIPLKRPISPECWRRN